MLTARQLRYSIDAAAHNRALSIFLCCCCHGHRLLLPCPTSPAPSPPLHHPKTGQFSTSSTGTVSGPNSFYWSGGYWGYCPPPGPLTAAAPAIPLPQNPGGVLAGGGTGTLALIRSPQTNMEFQTNDARGLAPVLLDAQGTQAGAGRNIVSVGWRWGLGCLREARERVCRVGTCAVGCSGDAGWGC
jgi:hypothetical protein